MKFFKKYLNSLFKGPKLNIEEARDIVLHIAGSLYMESISIDFLLANFEKYLEEIMQQKYPNNSMDPEEAKQIFHLSLICFENDKDYLELMKKNTEKYFNEKKEREKNPFAFEAPEIYRDPSKTYESNENYKLENKRIKESYYIYQDEYLSNFK